MNNAKNSDNPFAEEVNAISKEEFDNALALYVIFRVLPPDSEFGTQYVEHVESISKYIRYEVKLHGAIKLGEILTTSDWGDVDLGTGTEYFSMSEYSSDNTNPDFENFTDSFFNAEDIQLELTQQQDKNIDLIGVAAPIDFSAI